MFYTFQGSKVSSGQFRLYCNVGYRLNEETVKNYFQRLCTRGKLLDVYIPRHSSGRNKGYGFLTFQCEADLDNILLQTEYLVSGTVVKINRAGPRPKHQATAEQAESSRAGQAEGSRPQPGGAAAYGRGPRLYVGGIPAHITGQQIAKHFQKWGTVVDVYFPGKRGEARVSYCFVTFDGWQAAERASKETECVIDGEPVKSISVAEERSTLPPLPPTLPWQQMLSPDVLHLSQDEARGGTGPIGGGNVGQQSALAALQQKMAGQILEDTSLGYRDTPRWQQLLALNPMLAAELQTLDENLILSLQQQYQQQQQQQAQRESMLQQYHNLRQQPMMGSPGSQLPPRLMQELHAGVHELRISPAMAPDHQNVAPYLLPPPGALQRPPEGAGPEAYRELPDVGPPLDSYHQVLPFPLEAPAPQLAGQLPAVQQPPITSLGLPQEGWYQ